jgi:hypothetical protein
MKEYTNIPDFCRFVQNYEGSLIIRHNKAYSNGEVVAVLILKK